jgi:hypothetical protein
MVMGMAMGGQLQWQGGWQVTKRARVRAARVMEMTMRVVNKEEGKGGKVMARATRVAGEGMVTMTATKRAMAKKKRLGGTGDGNDQPLRATRQ